MKNFQEPVSKMSKSKSEFYLYYDMTCPLSRQIRVFLEETNSNFNLIRYRPFMAQDILPEEKEFINYNLSGKLPFMKLKEPKTNNSDLFDIFYIYGMNNCIEIINPQHLLPSGLKQKISTNNIFYLLNSKFYNEVTSIIIYEKITKYLSVKKTPDTVKLGETRKLLARYLKIFLKLISDNSKLTSESISISDIGLACHLSILDYISEINWKDHSTLKEWYLVIKSRPSFRKILSDIIPGFIPSSYYELLDF